MADINIGQAEADKLIAMEKHCIEEKTWLFPEPGGRLAVPLISPDKREWAIPAPVDRYPNVQDLFAPFEAFMAHCNITRLPQIEKGLFS